MSATIYPDENDAAPTKSESLCLRVGESPRETEPARLVDLSLGIFPLQSGFRQWIIRLVSPGSPFDNFILAMIVLNSMSMACVDYRHVDNNYVPSSEQSAWNSFVETAEVVFIVLFTFECIVKIIACGFFMEGNTYLRNHWNQFDFVVVMFSLLAMAPMMPNISALRSFRVLRPLRSISKLPGLKKIVRSLVDSLGDLANVMLLLAFFLACFSIAGVLFWKGILHARCRLTPFPVRLSSDCRNVSDACWSGFVADATENPEEYRCLPDPNDDGSWSQTSSPWFTNGPQDCIWPIDADDERVCSLAGTGFHTCPPFFDDFGALQNRTCGSNYDAFGNPRFENTLEPYGLPRMDSGVFIQGLNWGLTNYDSFWPAFVTTFQVVSMEGWTDVMYQVIDAWSVGPAVIIFVIIIVLGGYIVLNLVLAVITSSLDEMDKEDEQERKEDEKGEKETLQLKEQPTYSSSGNAWLKRHVDSQFHSNFIMLCIMLNTAVLSLDHYGISDELMLTVERVNLVFTLIFIADMIVCMMAIGIVKYWSNPFTCFDGVIAIISFAELMIMLTQEDVENGPSAFSVLRSLRLFRIFKMAKRWKSLQNLLRTMTETVQEIGNFAILLLLFIFIYGLVGMQLFSNRMHFDPDTGVAVNIANEGYATATVPRSNFDNLFTSMTTVFQLLSGENWNSVMYDGWRATSWIAAFYFLSLVVIGVFVVMNLFLAILLKSFEESGSFVDEARIEKMLQKKENRVTVLIRKSTIMWQNGMNIFDSVTTGRLVRSYCRRLVRNPAFDSVVTVLILASSTCLALDNPLANPDSTSTKTLRVFDLAFTIIFIVEMVVKILGYGLVFRQSAYLRNAWNVLDFIVVIISILNLANIGPGKVLRVLRTLRVLRPLRMVKRLPELKLVVDALLMSFPSVANVAVLCGLFFLIFASFGVNFLKGTFYHCDGEVFRSLSNDQVEYLTYPREWGALSAEQQSWFDVDAAHCKSSQWDPFTTPTSKDICDCLASGEWVAVVPQSFNNAISGMALLFEISTTEGWVDVMYAAIDQRGVEAQPVRDNNVFWALFFVVFLIIGAFFVLELFVGVTIDNFNKIREQTGRGLMTDAQREWASTQAFVMKIKPERRSQRPHDKIRAWCYDFIMPGTNPKFNQAITLCILLNSLCAAVVSFGDSDTKTTILEVLNVLFAAVFMLEVVIKCVALKRTYFQDGWNKFDFGIVCGSTVGLILSQFVPNISAIAGLVRAFRICRLFRLIKSVKKLRLLFNTMLTAIPSIVNIGSLLFLLFFMYSVGGVQLYSFVPDNENINHQANFRSFGNAMLLLLRFSTGENWNGFMRSMNIDAPGCDPSPTYNSTSPWCLSSDDYPHCTRINGCAAGYSVYLYFYSFTLLITFVIVNLFIGVVLEAFESSSEGELLSPEDLEDFTRVWAEFDPEATWYIKASKIRELVSKLEPPLGIGQSSTRESIRRVLNDGCLLEIPVNSEGMVNIVHVATSLAKRLAKQKQGNEFNELDDTHPMQQRILSQRQGMDKTLDEVFSDSQKRKMMALRAFVRVARAQARVESSTSPSNPTPETSAKSAVAKDPEKG